MSNQTTASNGTTGNTKRNRILLTIAGIALIVIAAFVLMQGTNQTAFAADPTNQVTYTLTIGNETVDLAKDFPSTRAVIGVENKLFLVSDDFDVEPMGITADAPLTLDPGKEYATLALKPGVVDAGVIKITHLAGHEYIVTSKDTQLVDECGACAATCDTVKVPVTTTKKTPTPTSTNQPGPSATPTKPGTSITSTPTTPVNPSVTPTKPAPTNTPAPTETQPAPSPEPTKRNCGVGNGVDGDTPGCPNGRNDGPGTGPGNPGSKGGNGNNTNTPGGNNNPNGGNNNPNGGNNNPNGGNNNPNGGNNTPGGNNGNNTPGGNNGNNTPGGNNGRNGRTSYAPSAWEVWLHHLGNASYTDISYNL